VTPRQVSHPSHSRGLADLAGLAPAMALFGVFIAVPMLGAVALSLFRWNGLGTPHWAGGAKLGAVRA
jgi:xylobiose transport system permease protein